MRVLRIQAHLKRNRFHAEGVGLNSRWQRHRIQRDSITTLKGSNELRPFQGSTDVFIYSDPWALPTAIKLVPFRDKTSWQNRLKKRPNLTRVSSYRWIQTIALALLHQTFAGKPLRDPS